MSRAPALTVICGARTREIPFAVGSSMREILEAADVPVRWGCQGNCACGLCAVRVDGGVTSEPTENELLLLSAEQIESGVRLACQLTAEDGLQIEILGRLASPASVESLMSTADSKRSTSDAARPAISGGSRYGVAIDVGTTHIRVSLCDLGGPGRIAGRLFDNPQSRWGADVMARLIAAGESTDAASRFADTLTAAIRNAVAGLCASAGVAPSEIARVRIVGNTPMLLLMTLGDPTTLLDPGSWTRPVECRVEDSAAFAGALGIDPDASVEVIQPLAGWVGSDLLAAVLATGLVEGPRGLLIDFGTNSEIALWDESTLWVTSAAGGPAFESFGLSCGIPAEEGAISSVRRDAYSDELLCDVIGGGSATGLCGSGLVDLIAVLRDTDELSVIGRLDGRHEDGLVLETGGRKVRVTNRDVDTFQRAKAAIGAGVTTLLGVAEMARDDIERVCVCGAFGEHLDSGNARRIGLLPDIEAARFELCSDAAVSGCELLLTPAPGSAKLQSAREMAVVVNLAQTPDFDALFLENLYLRPQGVTER